jgi:glycosyltransferase involved in cell wall biosynthesis
MIDNGRSPRLPVLPLVSILIPAWNSAPWIVETLDSALAQTHPRTEIIVIDDGSTDDTLKLARAHAARHPGRIQIATQPNSGASAARNHALRLAQGDFIQFLDADDLLSPRKIELQLALLVTRPPDTLATCRWGRFHTAPSSANFVDQAVFCDFTPIEYLLGHVGRGLMMHPAAWLVPRAVADRAGPWDESLSLNDDGEYFARVVGASAGLAFAADPAAASLYRSNLSASLSARRSAKALASLARSCELVDKHLQALEDSPRTRAALATYWQRLCYELYPDAPAASRAAELRASSLGGSSLGPPMGDKQRLLARLLGWRLTYQVRKLLPRF